MHLGSGHYPDVLHGYVGQCIDHYRHYPDVLQGYVGQCIENYVCVVCGRMQVHRGELMDGTEVAIKIIYPWLRKDLSSDFAVFRMMGDQIQPGGEHL